MVSPLERPEIAHAIIAASGDGAAISSTDLRVTWANERAHELLRARAGSLVGRHLYSFLTAEDLSRPKADWRSFHDGALRHVPMQARNDLFLTRDDTTQASFVIGASRLADDTVLLLFNEFEGRAEVEQRAEGLARRYQDLFQSIPVAVWEIDMRGLEGWLASLPCEPLETAAYLQAHPKQVVDHLDLLDVRAVNRAGLAQLEAQSAASEDVSKAMMGGARLDTLGGFAAQFQAVRTRTRSIVTEGVAGTGSGGHFFTEVHQFIPDGPDGPDLSRVIVTLIDTTRAKETEVALGTAIEARDRLITSVAHELRTPLTVVTGLLQLLRESPGRLEESDILRLVETATSEAEDLNHLIDDLLTYSRIDTSDWRISPRPTDLRPLIEQTPVRGEDGQRLALDINGEADCFADPRRVRQIVRNLATNSVRYGGPTVRVDLWCDESAHVEWRDNGAATADMERIFEPFHQAHSRPSQPSSLGLGLTISRGLADAMGGSLAHRRENGWTVFELILPRGSAPPPG